MDWPTPEDVVNVAGLPAAAADQDALADALAAGTATCRRLAPRMFIADDPAAQPPVVGGPITDDAWYAVCQAAALTYRGRGADYGIGTPAGAQSVEPGGDGWQGVRRLLGIGYYARPRVG